MTTYVALAGEQARERATISRASSWLWPLSLLRTRFRCTSLAALDFEPRELGCKGNTFRTRFEAALIRLLPSACQFPYLGPDAGCRPCFESRQRETVSSGNPAARAVTNRIRTSNGCGS